MLLSTWAAVHGVDLGAGVVDLLDRSDKPPSAVVGLPQLLGRVALHPGNTVWFVKHGVFGWRACLPCTPRSARSIWVLALHVPHHPEHHNGLSMRRI